MKQLQYLSVMIIITIIMGLFYVSVQQVHRTMANDPQIQLAQDLRTKLAKGASPASLISTDSIDLNYSLGTFTEAFDSFGKPVSSTGFIDGKMPVPPSGVFDFVRTNGEQCITWQPRKNIRLATVVVRAGQNPVQYLLVGRSLREVEDRVSKLSVMVGLCWILCLAIVGMNWLYNYYFVKRPELV